MKNLESEELERYRIQAPQTMVEGFNALLPESKVYSFQFPVGDANLTTNVSICNDWRGKVSTRISASIRDRHLRTRAVKPNELYIYQAFLQNPDECLVWQYNPMLQRMRASLFKSYMGLQAPIKMNNLILHTHEYNGQLPPLKEAYEKQLDGGKLYVKGTIGEWQFIHVYTKEFLPWVTLEKIAEKEFGEKLVQVFFNRETSEHPDEFVIWYHPNAQNLL